MNNQINLNTTIKQTKNYISSPLGDEVVMMDIEKGSYFSLDSIGTLIWNKIAKEIKVSTLCEYLMSISNVEEKQCQTDVIEFLEDLQDRNMIIVKNG